jgi:hypothetical protein
MQWHLLIIGIAAGGVLAYVRVNKSAKTANTPPIFQ